MKSALVLALLITIALAMTACSDSNETSRVSAAPPVAQPAATSAIAADESGFAASGPIVVENQVDVAALREGGRGNAIGFRRNRLRSILVIGEVALALVLLSGAGLLMRSFLVQRQTGKASAAA